MVSILCLLSLVYSPKEVSIDSSVLDRYAGQEYVSNVFELLKLIKKNNKLWVYAGTLEIELKPESETKLFTAFDKNQGLELDTARKVTTEKRSGNLYTL